VLEGKRARECERVNEDQEVAKGFLVAFHFFGKEVVVEKRGKGRRYQREARPPLAVIERTELGSYAYGSLPASAGTFSSMVMRCP
jgi:hypothetical protein